MSNPYLPLEAIAFPSQQFTAAFADETGNPSTTSAANRELWPPSIDVNETATSDYVTIECDKTTDTVTSIDVIVSGTFYIYVRGENRGTDPLTFHMVWPALWFDVYATDTPDLDIDGYDGRSDITDPLTITQFLPRFDGYPGLFGEEDLFVPGPGIMPLSVPVTERIITITDPATIALFEGASGTQNIYVKARGSTPQCSEDGGVTWIDFGAGNVYIDASRIRFIGGIVVNINRA